MFVKISNSGNFVAFNRTVSLLPTNLTGISSIDASRPPFSTVLTQKSNREHETAKLLFDHLSNDGAAGDSVGDSSSFYTAKFSVTVRRIECSKNAVARILHLKAI